MTWERLMSANVKGGKSPRGLGAGGRAAGLAPADQRIHTAVMRGLRQGVSVWGWQEFSRVQHLHLREHHPRLRTLAAPANWSSDHASIHNGLTFDRRVWELEDRDHLPVLAANQQLHLLVARLVHRETEQPLRVIVGHSPAGRSAVAMAGKAAVEQAVLRYRLANRRQVAPTAILFDANRAGAFPDFAGARHRVDVAVVRGLRTARPRVHHKFVRAVSDHAAVSIAIKLD